ncbi:MarR family transcriptional regulator [Leptospira sp. 2 VSF19]|uniref:MarR family transcriptional regulator n=1 Tax=Leptospira soteropolitanensis TaxID=2950025 RepID=A0AAW5VI13_9LEPT|nr:MarR family transcriptional regulator [Leptospira soteropolitanensis]MCW7492369.1 MarR family transcriptional regulator [Leptospira soteropolitanensis]MCW7499951.1 MarR family transcriptional regulator [Leptospira soteropolitanensis]MCW7522202.1 MarR family transcriptional regulator [Leptospira soteropolitanensis]MCW7526056.1 MarR family transcriptional regulator [Leptospira soteropolitanensis]MCW7529830.1 MarR family transcriptional regulator [Leptospira soteropolitanensis]
MPKKLDVEPSHLKSHLGYHLRVVSNAVSHSFSGKLASLDVTVAEWVILREMYSYKSNTAPSVIAETTGLSRGAVSKLIDRLLHKGLVSREEMNKDRRYQEIKLTKEGVRLVPKLAEIADENDSHFFSFLSEKEKNQLRKTLIKLTTLNKLNLNPIE